MIMIKKQSLLVTITLAALIGSSTHANAFFSFFSGLENIKRWAKIGTYSTLGILGYQTLVKPTSKIILGNKVKPLLYAVDYGLKASMIVGPIVGAFWIYDKFFSSGKIIQKITKAKSDIMSHVTDTVSNLKKYIDQKFEEQNAKIQTSLRKIGTTTSETNDLVKQHLQTN